MLEDVPDLTLKCLNEATQAWVEYEYNRGVHPRSARRRSPALLRARTFCVQAPTARRYGWRSRAPIGACSVTATAPS